MKDEYEWMRLGDICKQATDLIEHLPAENEQVKRERKLMAEHYRKSSPNYDPDKFRREFDVDKKERRLPSYVMLKKR